MKTIVSTVVILTVLLALPCVPFAADWPQYRGFDQTGTSQENVTLPWDSSGPRVVWKVPTLNGFSSFAISGNKVFTLVNRELKGERREVCVALDAANGKELWFADIDMVKYKGGDAGAKGNDGGDGPRTTPTINDGLVYIYDPNMVLHCLDAQTGKSLWTKDVIREHDGRAIKWNSAASPVIDGDLVFIGGGGVGQSLLAIHKKTGEIAWKAYDETITHATPVLATIAGKRQVIFYLQSGLLAVAPKDGKELWRFPMKFKTATAASPVVCGDTVFCTAGYGVGGAACKIEAHGDSLSATKLWQIPGDKEVASLWSTPVAKDDYLYGIISYKKFGTGPLKCIEMATGKIRWEQPGFGCGNVILVGDKLLALADDGNLVVVKAIPTSYQELCRTKAVTGKCWSTPSLSDGRIYVRSTKEGVCLDVK